MGYRIQVLDPRFGRYKLGNAAIERLHTGSRWVEGPAWNGVGKYLVWSDIPSDVQLRWLEDDARVSVFRSPAGNSNGNTFDFEGRQISCEHSTARVVRYEWDGSVSVLAETFEGKPLNAPNDAVVHPDDGGIIPEVPLDPRNGPAGGDRDNERAVRCETGKPGEHVIEGLRLDGEDEHLDRLEFVKCRIMPDAVRRDGAQVRVRVPVLTVAIPPARDAGLPAGRARTWISRAENSRWRPRLRLPRRAGSIRYPAARRWTGAW